MTDFYYANEKPRLLNEFNMFVNSRRDVLEDRFHEDEMNEILILARDRLELIIPTIPYIGGKSNQFSEELETSAFSLALYFVLKEKGIPLEDIGKLSYDLIKAKYEQTSHFKLAFMKRFIFSRISKNTLRKAAERSQIREYPDDFVIEYVEGADFDIGLDFTQCAICRFYEQQGALEFAKYQCLIDFMVSGLVESGLERTSTIAEGGERCDFRYKKGRPSRLGWPPKFLDEF